MKRFFLLSISISLTFIGFGQINTVVPAAPNPPRLVNDFANLLSPDQEQSLERKLVAYDDSTSSQFVIVTLPTLVDKKGSQYEDEEAALYIIREWKVGRAGKNNGLVILIVKNEDGTEKAIRIEVGYGLEGAIPDITASHIIQDYITPAFRDHENYYRGLDDATTALMRAAAGEFKAVPRKQGSSKRSGGIAGLIFLGIIFLFFMRGGRGGGGGMASRRGFGDIATGMILGSLLGGGRSGGGGGFGGGGFGGGGGGFGGFGGGSGGGGGASGSW